jgi:hypothetical protein
MIRTHFTNIYLKLRFSSYKCFNITRALLRASSYASLRVWVILVLKLNVTDSSMMMARQTDRQSFRSLSEERQTEIASMIKSDSKEDDGDIARHIELGTLGLCLDEPAFLFPRLLEDRKQFLHLGPSRHRCYARLHPIITSRKVVHTVPGRRERFQLGK